ncbi:MAG: CDP-diacylglycerol--serine O-phosphatidyltransferase [Rikenellaceae bacterium]
MKIKLFTIPNFITLSNLTCGVLAVKEVVANQDYTLAFWLIILAAGFDFLDGFVARLLNQQSPIGVQLDSLSDLVSFGLAPTFVLFSLACDSFSVLNSEFVVKFFPYAAFLIVAFSALRLAKFNIDDSQQSNFVGLPTPANALFCMSLGLICHTQGVQIPIEWLALISVMMSAFMVAPLDMFSLKFKGLGWGQNSIRYIFLAVAAIEIIQFKIIAMPIVVLTYIAISISRAVIKTKKA